MPDLPYCMAPIIHITGHNFDVAAGLVSLCMFSGAQCCGTRFPSFPSNSQRRSSCSRERKRRVEGWRHKQGRFCTRSNGYESTRGFRPCILVVVMVECTAKFEESHDSGADIEKEG